MYKKSHKFCHRCKKEKLVSEFYKRRNGSEPSPYCKPCTTEQTIERQRLFKAKCVEYLGGKCIVCGYDKYQGSLDFHHIVPEEKEFNISKVRLTKYGPKVEKELDKCILVCKNCHSEIHAGLINLSKFQGEE